MSSTRGQLSSFIFCSSKLGSEMILTKFVVRAAKCKFIVSLYLLGATYSGRDYVR